MIDRRRIATIVLSLIVVTMGVGSQVFGDQHDIKNDKRGTFTPYDPTAHLYFFPGQGNELGPNSENRLPGGDFRVPGIIDLYEGETGEYCVRAAGSRVNGKKPKPFEIYPMVKNPRHEQYLTFSDRQGSRKTKTIRRQDMLLNQKRCWEVVIADDAVPGDSASVYRLIKLTHHVTNPNYRYHFEEAVVWESTLTPEVTVTEHGPGAKVHTFSVDVGSFEPGGPVFRNGSATDMEFDYRGETYRLSSIAMHTGVTQNTHSMEIGFNAVIGHVLDDLILDVEGQRTRLRKSLLIDRWTGDSARPPDGLHWFLIKRRDIDRQWEAGEPVRIKLIAPGWLKSNHVNSTATLRLYNRP